MSQASTLFYAPAKLNLTLRVTGRRTDGYHLLDSVFCLIDLCDVIKLSVTERGLIRRLSQHQDMDEEQDLCVRAARLLQEVTDCPYGVDIALQKRIPVGAGLGGGSSDAAIVLMALNRLWRLSLPKEELMTLGLRLGADVPFFVGGGGGARVTGIGECLEPVNLPFREYLVVYPKIHISTAVVFKRYALTRCGDSEIMGGEADRLASNDLVAPALACYPHFRAVFDALRSFEDVRMSGSGSSLFIPCEKGLLEKVRCALAGFDVVFFVVSTLKCHPVGF